MLFCINDDQDLTTLTVDGLFYGHSCSQFLLIKSRWPPRLQGRPGFLTGWPAQDMGCEIWRR
jgi:hypothetical protein